MRPLVENSAIKASLKLKEQGDNVARMADWLTGEMGSGTNAQVAQVTQPS
jgi:hypothetical protein